MDEYIFMITSWKGAVKGLLKPLINEVTIGSDLPPVVSVYTYCTGVILIALPLSNVPV